MNRLHNILIVCAAVIFFCSCEKKKETTAAVYQPTMTFLKSQANLSMYVAALEKAQLQSYTEGPGPFTFFAPTNEAFAAAGISQDSLNRMTSGAINYLVQYHLVNALVTTTDLLGAQFSFSRGTQIGNTASTQVFLGNNDKGDSAYINGANIISANNMVSSGIVHVVNEFLIPPVFKGNLQSLLQNTGMHSIFIAALTKANRWAGLTGTGPFTVLAPTDAAMTGAGLTLAAVNAASAARVDSIVRYHYFSGARYFTNDFGNRVSTQTALGVNRTLKSSGNGRQVAGKSNVAPVNIVRRNILGTNGVLHVLDGVLLY
jgi:uncharacterized surface protein with fasciclin (FAS1) repeats